MGIDIPCTLCPLCELKVEDTQHLFFECPVADKYWRVLGNWWNVSIPIFDKSIDPLCWSKVAIKKKKEGAWFQVVVLALLVSIWHLRNGVIFEKRKVEVDKDMRQFIELSYFWLNSRNPKFKLELNSWLKTRTFNVFLYCFALSV